MKVMVLTLSVYQPDPSTDAAMHRLRWFTRSAEKWGVPHINVYGIGRTFPGYRVISGDWQRDYIKANASDYTHVLFHHGWDAMFCGPWWEILNKYEWMGSPKSLYAAHFTLGNVSYPEMHYPNLYKWRDGHYGYPQVGGHLSEINYIIEMFDRMFNPDRPGGLTGDDCFELYRAIEEGWFEPAIDADCNIFQCETANTTMKDGRLHNMITGSNPCIVHLAGGYNDPVNAKDEVMGQVAQWLGYEFQ